MIIYSLISNRGGMLRVVESLESIFNYLPKDFPLKVIIMGEEKPFVSDDPRFIFFETDDVSTPNASRKSLAKIRIEIQEMFKEQSIDWIVGDFMTLDCFEKIEAKICYDIHFLGRPFFEVFSRQKNMKVIDDFTSQALTLALHFQHLHFLKYEARFMLKADQFIVNSKSSLETLKKSYRDVINNKPISYIPVSSSLEMVNFGDQLTQKQDFYFHARFHPQKGIHFLLNLDWTALGLTMRGIEPSFLTPKNNDFLLSRGIVGLPWTSDSAIIRNELHIHDFILFPSIYEPWGLSLQEALAMGKICIAHRCNSGHEEQITDGVNGFLVDFSSPDILDRLKEIKNLSEEVKAKIKSNAQESSELGHEKRQKILAAFLLKLSQL